VSAATTSSGPKASSNGCASSPACSRARWRGGGRKSRSTSSRARSRGCARGSTTATTPAGRRAPRRGRWSKASTTSSATACAAHRARPAAGSGDHGQHRAAPRRDRTGKELFARAIHAQLAPAVSDCASTAALPPTLIESELFGHEKGAFTDAVSQRQGRFELAHRGTLFLDEIGDLPLELQAKLLRVLQEGEFERIGTSRTKKVDVRIVAATHRDLSRAVVDGDFREDLYYRLNVFPIRLPPLRERREDIPALVWATIRKRQRAVRRSIAKVPQSVMDALMRHEWPGNIRQLENVVERALIHSTGDTLMLVPSDLDELPSDSPDSETTLSSVERTYIEKVLRECGWRINGAGNTAERLGLHPNTLRFRMKKLGIVRARPRRRRLTAHSDGTRHRRWRRPRNASTHR
jgi:hypothetical protein